MQALILADREIIGLTGLGNSNEPWMVEIDGVPIIERMLTQLDNSIVSRIILITRDNKESLIEFTERLNLKTELVFLENSQRVFTRYSWEENICQWTIRLF